MTRAATTVLLLLLAAGAAAADDPQRRASRLLDEGRNREAEAALLALVKREPGSAGAHRLLGDVYRRTRRFAQARAEYREALRLDPGDREARDSYENLKRRRGVSIFGALGDWESDSSGTKGWQAEAFFGGSDNLDPYLGASYSDKYFYTRHSYYGRFYRFFSPTGYVRVSPGYRSYDYPQATNPVPDANSYQKVPRIEVEVADNLSPSLRGSVAYEYYHPNFFHAPDDHASNHKLSGELTYRTPYEPLRLRLITALLRDPDPARTFISRPAQKVLQLEYGTQFLLGGGGELSFDRVSGELLVLPNRDMDRSLRYSILGRLSFSVRPEVSLTLHHTFDRYSDQSPFAGDTGRLTMLTAGWRLLPGVDLSGGVKLSRRPSRDETGPFLTILYRPGKP